MKVLSAIVESLALVLLTFWTLSHIEASSSFAEGMAGVLIAILALWAMAWGVPDGLSMFDRSIELRRKVFGRSD